MVLVLLWRARLRMTSLYFIANTLNYLVAGTGNRLDANPGMAPGRERQGLLGEAQVALDFRAAIQRVPEYRRQLRALLRGEGVECGTQRGEGRGAGRSSRRNGLAVRRGGSVGALER